MNTKITTKTQYAVAAMLELARLGEAAAISVISSNQSIEQNYMSIIMLELKKKNLVLSIRGVKGGYKLAKPVESISVSEIMEAVGEKIRVTRCKDDKGGCNGGKSLCLAHKMWRNLELKIESYLSSVTLKDMLQSSDQLNFSIKRI